MGAKKFKAKLKKNVGKKPKDGSSSTY